MRIKIRFSLIILCVVALIACKHYPEDMGGSPGSGNPGPGGPSCDPDRIYFQQQVLPILISNCTLSGCHNDASHQDGVILTTYEKVMSTGGIEPGNPDDSELYEMITESDPDDRMPRPPVSPLSASQIQVIRQWITQGAQNLSCASACDTSSFSYSLAIKPLISNKCQGCHGSASASGGIDLSTYAGVKARVTDGRLWGAINHQPGFTPMPRNGNKLSDCEITQVRKWIESGSLNN